MGPWMRRNWDSYQDTTTGGQGRVTEAEQEEVKPNQRGNPFDPENAKQQLVQTFPAETVPTTLSMGIDNGTDGVFAGTCLLVGNPRHVSARNRMIRRSREGHGRNGSEP